MINRFITRSVPLFTAAVMALTGLQLFAAEVTISPSMDNTIAQGIDPGSGENFEDNSSGACGDLFSGVTNDGLLRRALLQFDIAGNLPPGSTITGVSMSVTVNRSGDNQDATMTLHPVSLAWGEGTATCGPRGGGQGEPAGAGDATWIDAEFGITPWSSPGGDFGDPTSAVVGSGNGSVGTWNSAAMVGQVQAWLDGTTINAGWIVVGDEAGQPARGPTSRRLSSREGSVPPTLTITFDPPPGSVACCFDSGACSVELDALACTGVGGTPASPATDTCEPNPCPQPIGVCCNVDQSCSEAVARDVCEDAGGAFQVDANACNQVDCGLTPFVDAMPVPPVLQPTGTRADGVLQYTVSVEEATQNVHSELPNTDLWTYNGAWPAATIVTQRGTPIEVRYENNLPSAGNRGGHILDVDECAHGPNYYSDSPRVVTHLHGGHVPSRVDGQPEYTILPGEIDIYEYPNNQDAATTWYHDHALGITRLNVYSGMAGFYLMADAEDTLGPDNAFGLPSGQYEIGMAIQDREFNDDGSLFYNPTLQNAFKGDVITVNGKVWPFLNVDQGKYRFRLLNGSQSREYSLRLENITEPGNDPSFTLVGTDLGLTTAPINLGNTTSLMAPAERFDVVIDFAGFQAGTEIVVRNDDLTTPLIPNVMKFVVTNQPGYTGAISQTLRTVDPLPANSANGTRYFRLARNDRICKNEPDPNDPNARTNPEWVVESLDGPGGNVIGEEWDDLTEFPLLGTREIWEFENPTNSPHPMHVHLVRFQILDKETLTGQPIPLEPHELGTWKDIVRVAPNSRARIIMDFEDYLGRFPQHCHILDHEDHEMMRQFQTINDPANCVVDGVCSAGEDCVSCAADCAQVSGASCGNGLCEAGDGENCVTCPEDCAGKQKGSASKQFCCGAPGGTNNIGCGVDVADDRCINSADNLFCRSQPRLSACCGDALCEGAETIASCGIDCDPNACVPTELGTEVTCDDGQDNDCDGLIDAADPDCQVCVPDETPEQSCFDGNDNDCDLAVDCSDGDCNGAIGAPTTCGIGVCASTGNLSCSGGGEIDTCTPGTPGNEGPFGDASCSDNLDNDCDGLTDAIDPDCQSGGVVCEEIFNKSLCRDQPTCQWKKNACVTR